MVVIPDASPRYNDLVDAIIQHATKIVEVENDDGTKTMQEIIDDEIFWWSTLDVNSEKFSRFAFEVKEWERQALIAFDNMPKERAIQTGRDIIEIGKSWRRSMDAKGSESRRDKHNAKSTILDKIGRNKVERIYTQKGQIEKGFTDSFLGRKQKDDMDNDN